MTLNWLFWGRRDEEPILATAIYKFHPDFAGKVNVWWGDPTKIADPEKNFKVIAKDGKVYKNTL